MIDLYLYTTCVIFYLFVGWDISKSIAPNIQGLTLAERLSLSYGLGLGFVSLGMLIMSIFGLRLNLINILAPWVGYTLVSRLYHRRRSGRRPAGRVLVFRMPAGMRAIDYFLIFGVGVELSYAFFRALIKPIESYDAVAIYAIKAKMIYLAGSITGYVLDNAVRYFPHPDYPLNIPIAEAFGYIFMANMNDLLVKALFPIFFAALLCITYSAVRRIGTRSYALLFTFILASIPQVNAYAQNAYLDLVLSFYCFASAIFIFKWMQDTKGWGCLMISAAMAGLGGWTKNEGLMYCGVNILVICMFAGIDRAMPISGKIKIIAVYIATLCAISLPWALIKANLGIANDEIDMRNINPVYLAGHIGRIGPVLYEFQKEFFGPKKWNIFWPSCAITMAFAYKRLFTGVRMYIAAYIALAIIGYIVFYIVSYVDVRFFAGKTWSRFLVHFLPIVLYYVAHIMKEEKIL